MSDYRQEVVALADDLFVGKTSHEKFRESLPDYPWEDSEVDYLVDSIVHEPRVGGFLGVSKAEGQKNRAEILQRLERLRQN